MIETEHELSDEDLVSLIRQGDKEKFGILMARYEEKLFRYARRFLSKNEHIEDMVQEVFVKAYTNLQSFDLSQKFSSWIYRIAHNTFVNELRRQSRTPISFFDFDTLVGYSGSDSTAEEEFEREELKKMIDKSLSLLKPQAREAIILHYLEDLSYREIADILHVPIGTVGVRLKRAKDALRREYEKLG
ncbi:MAG TPA: RNA polymerase sigma factor [Candidatus Paceibacterota bacterium]|nr:RNA polymerase sigma factor [Candidatus Paceibacterota bacterium]